MLNRNGVIGKNLLFQILNLFQLLYGFRSSLLQKNITLFFFLNVFFVCMWKLFNLIMVHESQLQRCPWFFFVDDLRETLWKWTLNFFSPFCLQQTKIDRPTDLTNLNLINKRRRRNVGKEFLFFFFLKFKI